jgi:hypothetical protein
MATLNWELFIKERLRGYDPDINLNQGSRAMIQVVGPVVSRLSPDPIDTNLKLFLLTRLAQEHPQLYAREGSTLGDMLVKPSMTFFEPFKREVRSVRNQLSLSDPLQLTADEADALMANFFISRNPGDYARVKVRLYFQNPVSVNVSSTNVAWTAEGTRFIPVQSQSITAEGMLFNTDGSLYYFDVNYIAEQPGSRYNIGPNEIAGVTGLQAATRAVNLARATPGSDEETTEELIARGERSIGERSLNTLSGIVALLFEEFSDLQILQVLGFNDAEMQRDVLTGGSLGPVLHNAVSGETADDGDADGYTTLFTDTGFDFAANLGPVGTDISDYTLTVFNPAIPSVADYLLGEVTGTNQVSINSSITGTDRLPEPHGPLYWTIRKSSVITLSDIPGGIVFPNDSTGQLLEVADNEVHVGGCVDFYVRGNGTDDETAAVTVVADQDAIARREDATTDGTTTVVLNDITTEEFDQIVPGRTSLYLEESQNEGAYRILDKTAPDTVIVDSDTMAGPSVSDVSYVVVDDVDIDLLYPKDVKYIGTDLKTVAGSPVLTTLSSIPDFVGVGAAAGDYISIENGPDEGEYEIPVGGVASGVITLSVNMTSSRSPLQYRIYRKQTGIDLPMLRVKTVELLDSSLEPTGSFVPYRHPVDAQSNSFQNPGRGANAGTSETVTEDSTLSSTAGNAVLTASDTAIDYYALGVRAGDLVNLNDSDNQGFYTVLWAGGDPNPSNPLSNSYELQVTENLQWTASGIDYTVGAPSYGSFRLYFLDPLSFEAVYDDMLIAVTLDSGAVVNYRPSPEVYDQYLPTEVTIPTVALSIGTDDAVPWDVGGATNIDFRKFMLEAGDRVEITYAPLVGSAELSAGGYNLDNKSILLDVGLGLETVTFSGTSLSVDEIISQINAQVSTEVASKFEDPGTPGDYYVKLSGDLQITIGNNNAAGANDATEDVFGTNRQTWNKWLAADTFANKVTDNDAPDKGLYTVSALATYPTGGVSLDDLSGSALSATATIQKELGHYIRVSRLGRQRIDATAMLNQGTTDLGFYYFDIECISQGYGDQYNIGEDQQGTASGYYSEGWNVRVLDENLAYSMAEEPWMDISPRVLVAGTTADETNKQELVSTNLQITYEKDALVEQVHDYVRDRQSRVICMSPLARALFPTFVRTSITYTGGDTESNVRAELAEYIEAILPDDQLEVSDMTQLVGNTGATKISMPVTVVGIAHGADRSVTVERSRDAISLGRLSALIPDDAGTIEGASYIILTRNV